MLFRESDPTRGLGAFLQLGFAESDRSPIAVYLGTGLNYIGLLPGRDRDVLGFAMAHARNSHAFLEAQPAGTPRAETSLELTYRAELLPWLRLQPDVQYIIHPGTNPHRPNALVLTLQVRVTL